MTRKTIMIVDDEFYIRNGLVKILPWEDFGYSVIAVANDGKDALDFLAKKQPDILFTDIMMPKIDGIELTKTISEKWPTIIVIVLSSYNDFHYVKTALKNGASEYLLKPSILPENLLELVRKVCPPDHSFKQKFSYNTEKKSNKIDSLVENTFNFPYFFGFLIGENTFFTSHEIQELVTPFLINTSYKIINLQVNESYFILINHTIENFKLRLTPLKIPYIFFQNTTDLIFLKEQIELATQFYQNYTYYFTKSYFIWDSKQIISQDANFLPDQKKIATLIKREHFSDAIILLRELTLGDKLFLKEELQNFFNSMIISLLSKMEDSLNQSMGMKKIDFLTINQQSNTLKQTLQNIRIFLDLIHQDFLEENEDTIKQQILDYIQKHHAEGINLASIAEQFHFNYNYLSRIFTTYTGSSFTDYLNNIRIKEAKIMLKQSNLSIAKISEKVGYTDTSYFSKVFKKIALCSPSDYRRSHSND